MNVHHLDYLGQWSSMVIFPYVMYTRLFHCLFFLLFQHGGKMSSIWRPFNFLGDYYVDKVVDMVSL
jgi:hypothetical protein